MHPNVATRAKELTHALLAFGEALALLQSEILEHAYSSVDTVGLDREELRNKGWWSFSHIEPITRHLSLDMTEDAFLDRCEALCKMLIECYKEGDLRKILEKLGCSHEKTKELGGLRLLNLLINLCQVAVQSGLQLLDDSAEVLKRFELESERNRIPHIFALYELRKLKSHRNEMSRPKKMKDVLDTFDIECASTVPGWGSAADRVYDALIEELVFCQKTLRSCISGR